MLIWVFVGRTCQKVRFLTFRLILVIESLLYKCALQVETRPYYIVNRVDQYPSSHLYSAVKIKFLVHMIISVFFGSQASTVHPIYTESQHNDEIRYNDNLTSTKLSIKRWRLIRNSTRAVYLILQETYVLDMCKHRLSVVIRVRLGISCIPFCLLRILYNNFILMVASSGTNAVVVSGVQSINHWSDCVYWSGLRWSYMLNGVFSALRVCFKLISQMKRKLS